MAKSYFEFPTRAQERACAGLPYIIARTTAGLTQGQAATMTNTERTTWCRNEAYRKRYHVRELAALRKLSGLTWDEFGAILDEAAKPL